MGIQIGNGDKSAPITASASKLIKQLKLALSALKQISDSSHSTSALIAEQTLEEIEKVDKYG